MENESQLSVTELKRRLRSELSVITNDERAGMAKIIQLDLLKELSCNLGAFDSITENQWKKTVTKLKNYKKYIKIDGDKFTGFIDALLPLLGAYLGCMFTFKKNKENDIEAGIPLIKKKGTNKFTETAKEAAEAIKIAVSPDDSQSISYIPNWCKEEVNKFAYHIKESYIGEKTNTENNCVISMCTQEESADTSVLTALSPIRDSKGIVVEYDSGYSHKVNVQVGSVISFDENIGSINKLPVKSQIRGLVIKKEKDYFIANYLDETPEIDVDKLIEKYDNAAMEEICDLFNNNAHVTNFIKDYLLETRIPALANHILGATNDVSYDKYAKKFRKEGRKILEKYEKQTKQDCSKTNIEAYGKASKLHKLKEKLDSDKRKTFNQILDLYNGYKEIGYRSKGRIADFMLYDEYIDFLMDEEKFRYDDKNPYVVKMFKLLCKFVGTRSKIEKNMDNLPSLKNKFNKLCKQTLKSYWRPNNDYYAEMKDIFKFDYYTNDTERLIQALVTDKDSVSLYSKVYDYLKALCHYTTPDGTVIQYSDEIDVKALLRSEQKDNTDRTMDDNLKKIAYNFCLLRNVETNANDKSIYESIANRAIVLAFYYLNLISGVFIEEYYDGYVGIDPIVIASQAILRPYLKTLKKITQSEEYEMNELAKKAIQWYAENGEKINDPHIFDQFKEIPWGASSRIVYDNEYYDYVFLRYEVNDSASMIQKIENEPFNFDGGNENDDYYETLACAKTKFNICSFPYWMRYLTMATLVNCMMPIYWGTGIIILGAPIILPIIMLPIFVLPGRITVVFGIALCGICPMPLILFANLSNTRGSVIIPLNILADTLKASLKQLTNSQKKAVDLAFTPLISGLDIQINAYNKELDNLENQIHNVDSFIKDNQKILRNIKKRKKKDPASLL